MKIWKQEFENEKQISKTENLGKNKFLANQVDEYEAGMNGKGYMRDKSGDLKKVRISLQSKKKKSSAGKLNLLWKKPLKNFVKGKKSHSWK